VPRFGTRRRNEPLDRHPRRRRADVLSPADAPRRARLLFALRRCGRIAGLGPIWPAVGAGDGTRPPRARTADRPAPGAGPGGRSMRGWRNEVGRMADGLVRAGASV